MFVWPAGMCIYVWTRDNLYRRISLEQTTLWKFQSSGISCRRNVYRFINSARLANLDPMEFCDLWWRKDIFFMQLRAPSNYIFSRSKLWFTATARSRNKLEQFHNRLEEINSIPQAVSLEQPNSCPYDEVCLFYIQRYHIYNTAHIILSSGNWHSSDIPHLPRYSWR